MQDSEQIKMDQDRENDEKKDELKQNMNFKATPIRRYKPIDSSHIPHKELTCPVKFDFQTEKRSQLRDHNQDDIWWMTDKLFNQINQLL